MEQIAAQIKTAEDATILTESQEQTPPILTLPNEIVAEIFSQYLPPYPTYPSSTGEGSPEFLRTICRRWRNLALHTPSLWRAFQLGLYVTEKEIKRFEEWLQRSGSTPLSLFIDIANANDEDQSAAVLRLLGDNRFRWEYITLALKPSEVACLSGYAPLLVRFKLVINTDEKYQTPIRLKSADRLRFLSLWNVPRNDSSVHWEQLTCMSLFNVSIEDAAHTVALAPNLRCCAFSLREAATYSETFIQHSRIDTLILIYFIAPHLDALILPSLRRLEISGYHTPANTGVDSLRGFTNRSRCRLTHLRLVDPTERVRSELDKYQSALPGTLVLTASRKEQLQEEENWWMTDEYWRAEET
ncbi:F-box domain-containing protein [Mycena chlorophos]|uniref:F-box domain-containing protein n=1 Tax=Mycena chlorophos TaxID=658473 RepID=A0A8H6S754_MYCCL|nr:F-box domain-containing protein [Mycena chlorophos]